MLIFHKFPNTDAAQAFAATHDGSVVCADQDESDKVDPFPLELVPPIVLVPRASSKKEEEIEDSVSPFGGEFAGT